MTSPSLGIKCNVVYHAPLHSEFVPSSPRSCSCISIVQTSQIFSSSTNTYQPFWKHASEACRMQGKGRSLRLRARKMDRSDRKCFFNIAKIAILHTSLSSVSFYEQNSPKSLDFSFNVDFVFIQLIIDVVLANRNFNLRKYCESRGMP